MALKSVRFPGEKEVKSVLFMRLLIDKIRRDVSISLCSELIYGGNYRSYLGLKRPTHLERATKAKHIQSAKAFTYLKK